jgi:hypothetical protein
MEGGPVALPLSVRAGNSEMTGYRFMKQACSLKLGWDHQCLGFVGCTVSRTATSDKPSKTSRTWLQVKQRNPPG